MQLFHFFGIRRRQEWIIKTGSAINTIGLYAVAKAAGSRIAFLCGDFYTITKIKAELAGTTEFASRKISCAAQDVGSTLHHALIVCRFAAHYRQFEFELFCGNLADQQFSTTPIIGQFECIGSIKRFCGGLYNIVFQLGSDGQSTNFIQYKVGHVFKFWVLGKRFGRLQNLLLQGKTLFDAGKTGVDQHAVTQDVQPTHHTIFSFFVTFIKSGQDCFGVF